MNEYLQFRGVAFHRDIIWMVRKLARGEVMTVTSRYDLLLADLNELVLRGYANKEYSIEAVPETGECTISYSASSLLLELPDIPPISFDQMAEKRGLSFDSAHTRKWRKPRPRAEVLKYPPIQDVRDVFRDLQKRTDDAGKRCIVQLPVEPEDSYQFSSPELTAWYVTQFCSDNYLKQ